MAAISKPYDCTDDAAAGVDITASRIDAIFDTAYAAINLKLDVDGSVTSTSNQPMGGYRHTGVGNASSRNEYAAAGQIQDGSFLWGGIGGGIADVITIAVSPIITAYVAGQLFYFLAGGTNTTATTINVNSVGAKDIYKNGVALVGGEIVSGKIYAILYDGTQFNLISVSAGLLNMLDYKLVRPEIKDFGYTTNGAFPNATGAVTIDIAATGNVYSCTATGNLTFTFSNPSASGVFCPLLVAVKQDGTGSRTITWPGSVNGTPTTATTTAAKVDFYQFGTWDGGTTWYILGERIGQ